MSNELSELDELSAEAVRAVIANGQWQSVPELALHVSRVGLDAIRLQDEATKQLKANKVETGDHIDAEGWHTDITSAWRLVLNSNLPGSCVVYFASEPDYATVKAFARAAGVPVNQVQAEQRTDG